MALYMIEWTSPDVKASSSAFMSGAFSIPPPLKLLSSVHSIDKPSGWVLVEGSPDDFYAAVLAFPPNVLDLQINAVVDDNAAKHGLEHRNSAYKMK